MSCILLLLGIFSVELSQEKHKSKEWGFTGTQEQMLPHCPLAGYLLLIYFKIYQTIKKYLQHWNVQWS